MAKDLYKRTKVDSTYTELNERHLNIYRFVLRYSHYIYSTHAYGPDAELTMIESHTLSYIDDNPGTTPSELVKYWELTKGSISQILKRLEDMGLIEKRKDKSNCRLVHLYLTDKGREASLNHKNYDIKDIAKTMGELGEELTEEEIATFFKALSVYNGVIERDFELNEGHKKRRGHSERVKDSESNS